MAKRTISLFLLKEEVGEARDAVAASGLRSYAVRDLRGGTLFLRRTHRDEPEWLTFLRPHLTEQPGARSTASLSGLLVFELQRRWFAVAFGYGRMLLDPEMVVSDFGLRAAFNSVDPDELQSIDAKTLEELTVNTRRQLSRGSSITTFELDLHRDLVKAVRGRSSDPAFADHVAGSAALRITGDLKFEDIKVRAGRALQLYGSHQYQTRFGWIDHIKLIVDPAKQDRLDRHLESLIRAGEATIYLAAPTLLDEDDFGGFKVLSTDSPTVFDLRWSDYVALKQGPPTLRSLKRDRIAVISSASGQPAAQWSVYRAIVAEFEEGGARYVLSGGDWFEVEQNYARETRQYVERFEQNPLALPSAGSDEHEGDYNARVCQELDPDAALLDRRPFRATQSQDNIEFCDILLKPNRIVHVKRKSASSTLSHLFNQGLVSGELLQFDEGFRTEVREALAAFDGFGDVVPSGPLAPASFEVAYAVIASEPRGDRHFLPFFSQVSFRRAAEHLTSRGYRVSLSRVGIH
jgi:uncharacterized protein (TIGR04141 family)